MRIKDAIAYVDSVKPNAFDDAAKILWLNEVEGLVQTEAMLFAVADLIEYTADTDPETELLVRSPHDKIYRAYLVAMVDFANGEYNRYANTVEMFNTYFSEYVVWYADKYRPADGGAVDDGYYITAYGIAVKHGFEGDEAAWLKTLKGEPGRGFEIRGKYDTAEQLQAAVTGPEIGDAYAVGTEEPYHVFIWGVDGWFDFGTLKGERGERGEKGERGDVGATGRGFAIMGRYDTVEQLQAAVVSPLIGDAYAVGTEEPYHVFIWGVDGWFDFGTMKGEPGRDGRDGADGRDGKDGYTPQKGVDYTDGKDGADGYTPQKGVDYFTDADKEEIAREAAKMVEIPEVDDDDAVKYTPEERSEAEQAQARENIGAASVSEVVELGKTIPKVYDWAIAKLPFTEAQISNTASGAGFVVNPTNFADGKTYFRYHAGSTSFAWTNPNPQKGAVTITVLGWSQYADKATANGFSALNIAYADGTTGRLQLVNGQAVTMTTDAGKVLTQIKGNYDHENWVLLDMDVLSIVADYPAPTGTVKSVNGNLPDEDGNVEIDIPEGGSGGDSLGDFELFTEVVTDNAETSVFDFSTNEAGQSLADKNYKEVFLVSPDKSNSGVNASGSAADVSAKVLINGKFTIYMPTFGRAGGGILYVGLIVKDGGLDVLVHGRDGFQYLTRSGTMDVTSSFEASVAKLSKVYTKYSYNGTMGKIEVSPKVERIESLVVTITNGYSGSNVTYKIWGRA